MPFPRFSRVARVETRLEKAGKNKAVRRSVCVESGRRGQVNEYLAEIVPLGILKDGRRNV